MQPTERAMSMRPGASGSASESRQGRERVRGRKREKEKAKRAGEHRLNLVSRRTGSSEFILEFSVVKTVNPLFKSQIKGVFFACN